MSYFRNAHNRLFGKPSEDNKIHHVGPVKYSDPKDVATYEVDALHILRSIYKNSTDTSWPSHHEVLRDLESAGYRIIKKDTIPAESIDVHEVNRRLDDFRHSQTAWNKAISELQFEVRKLSGGPNFLNRINVAENKIEELDKKVTKHVRISQRRNRVLRERVRRLEKPDEANDESRI